MSTQTLRREELIIFDGADLTAIDDAYAAYGRAKAIAEAAAESGGGNRRFGEDPVEDPVKAAAAEYDRIKDEAAARGTKVVVQALFGRIYRKKMLAVCPPRPGNRGDALYGFDQDAMADLLPYYIDEDRPEVRTVVEPVMEPDELVEWIDGLRHRDFVDLMAAAVLANQGESPDPTLSLASQHEAMSSGTSEPLARMG